MTTSIARSFITPTNLQISWHPFMSAVPDFFSDCPNYSLPSIISERQELASRIHFNFHLIGCLFKSIENRHPAMELRRIYDFVFSCPTRINQKIHNVFHSLIGQMRSDFIMGIIDLSSKNLNFFVHLSSQNFGTTCELVNRINQIPSEERQGVLEFAIRILEDCPSTRPRFLLDVIRAIPLEEREEVITITLSLLTNKENIKRPDTLVNIIRSIPSHERVEVLELAGHLFSQNFCSDDIQRQHVIHEIYRIPSNERAEVVRLAEPILNPRTFRQHRAPLNSEYAYAATEEYTVLSALGRIPSEYRRFVIYISQPFFEERTGNPARAQILREIAREVIR